jgi:putative (di)nucleoside polyphosphate hydrolase
MDGSGSRRDVVPNEHQWALVQSTYENHMHALTENEALGERRVQVFLTVISAAGIAIGLVANRTSVHALLAIGAGVSFLLTVLGFLTNMRIAQRNTTTSRYKLDLYRLRRYIAGTNERLIEALPFMKEKNPQLRARPWYPSRGGLVEFVGILTGMLAGVGAFCGVYAAWRSLPASLAAAVVAAISLWLLQVWAVRVIYSKEGCLSPPRPASETFRANVGMIVRNAEGQVLVARRNDHPESWQFPQGGINRGEHRLNAAFRELKEETNLGKDDITLVRDVGQWLAYELPEEERSKKTGLGQVQWWCVFQHRGGAPLPDVKAATAKEFTATEWVTFDEAVNRAVGFKRHVYEKLRAELDEEAPT